MLKYYRFRYPRVLPSSEEPIHCYEKNLAHAKELTYKLIGIDTDKVLLAEYFESADTDFDNNIFCMAIIAYKYFFIVYNYETIIFQIKINEIKDCSLHYIEDKFVIKFVGSSSSSIIFSRFFPPTD